MVSLVCERDSSFRVTITKPGSAEDKSWPQKTLQVSFRQNLKYTYMRLNHTSIFTPFGSACLVSALKLSALKKLLLSRYRTFLVHKEKDTRTCLFETGHFLPVLSDDHNSRKKPQGSTRAVCLMIKKIPGLLFPAFRSHYHRRSSFCGHFP